MGNMGCVESKKKESKEQPSESEVPSGSSITFTQIESKKIVQLFNTMKKAGHSNPAD